MGNQSSTSSSTVAFSSHTSSPLSVASGTRSTKSLPGRFSANGKKRTSGCLAWGRNSACGEWRASATLSSMGQKLSLRRMASLSDDDDDLVSIASGTRSLPNRRKTSRANKKSPISLFPLASAGRKPRRGRKNSGNIDDDLDSIIAFVKHMHQTADGKQKLENMVINNIKNPAESDSTQLFLTEISETVSVPTPCASKNRRTLPRCQTA